MNNYWVMRSHKSCKIYDAHINNIHLCIQEFPDGSAAWWKFGELAHHSRTVEVAIYNSLNKLESLNEYVL